MTSTGVYQSVYAFAKQKKILQIPRNQHSLNRYMPSLFSSTIIPCFFLGCFRKVVLVYL